MYGPSGATFPIVSLKVVTTAAMKSTFSKVIRTHAERKKNVFQHQIQVVTPPQVVHQEEKKSPRPAKIGQNHSFWTKMMNISRNFSLHEQSQKKTSAYG